MSVELTPIRWPGRWDSSALALLKGTPINCLVVDRAAASGPVVAQARQSGLTVADAASPPAGVFIAEGVWPGVQAPQSQANAESGPTGTPWVDSNGWKVRLEAALHPQAQIWIDAKPKERVPPESCTLALADAAAHGGKWIITLDEQFAGGVAQGNSAARSAWKKLAGAAQFFADRKAAWASCLPSAVVGIISDFTGDNEFMGQELCNLIARTNQQYRIIPKNRLTPSSFANLKAVIYGDAAPPAPALKDRIMAFVQAGGMLITHPKWGIAPGMRASNQDNDRYVWRTSGKGRIAFARSDFDDPWVIAQETPLLISHRYDLLRFWNDGSVGSYFTAAPDGKRAVVHMLYYANSGPDESSVRVAGPYRKGKLWTLDRADPRPIEMDLQNGAAELHLPAIEQYAAAELEA